MIIYCTKQTLDRYNLKDILLNQEDKDYEKATRENEESLLKWGAKLFYVNSRKCLALCHFESKYTIFIYDLLKKDLKNLGFMIETYIEEFYKDDKQMDEALRKYFRHCDVYFTCIHERSIISTLNRNILDIDDGYSFYEFVEDDIFDSIAFNNDFMDRYLTKATNRKEYIYPKDEFKKLILEYYSN